ncbi:MAG: hypothetical protein ABW176_05815 [Candidatus Thiodiazotropha endolucinida]
MAEILKNKYFLLAPYALTVSTLYLLGYWSTFGINIFEYLTFSEVIKITIQQLISYGLPLVIGVFIFEIYIGPPFRKIYPPGEGAKLPEAKFFRFFFNILIPFTIALCAIIFYSGKFANPWLVAGTISAPAIATTMYGSTIISNALKGQPILIAMVYALTVILVLSYGWGKNEALTIKASSVNTLIEEDSDRKRYLGRTSGHVFFWNEKSNSIEIFLSKNINTMSIELIPEETSNGNETQNIDEKTIIKAKK